MTDRRKLTGELPDRLEAHGTASPEGAGSAPALAAVAAAAAGSIPEPPVVTGAPDAASTAVPPAQRVASTNHPVRRRRRWIIAGGALVVLVALVAGLTRGGEDKRTLHVAFMLTSYGDTEGTTGDCRGTGGYDDFGAGMDIVVRNGNGDIIGSGSTVGLDAAPPYFLEQFEEDDMNDNTEGLCMVVADVQAAQSEYYEVSVGRRGSTTHTADELDESKNEVVLTLG